MMTPGNRYRLFVAFKLEDHAAATIRVEAFAMRAYAAEVVGLVMAACIGAIVWRSLSVASHAVVCGGHVRQAALTGRLVRWQWRREHGY